MKKFTGFPSKMEFTPIPNAFFSSLLPQISDIAELKVTLFIFGALYRKRGYPRFVTYHELSANVSLMKSLEGREAVAKIKSGELILRGLKVSEPVSTETLEPSDIFTLYEQNIGMLNPMIVEELKEAEGLYPKAWIEDAFKEAVSLNKRHWRYIAAILERWSAEGRSDGAFRRDFAKRADQEKYFKQKYGHMVKR